MEIYMLEVAFPRFIFSLPFLQKNARNANKQPELSINFAK